MRTESLPLVGRQQELASLVHALDSLERGDSGVAVVAGPPGIGKSRLLAECTRLAGERGITVLDGRASELERAVPFSVVVDALDDYVHALADETVAGLSAEDHEECAFVFPALRASAPPRDGRASPDDRVQAYFAIRRLLEQLALTRPLLLVLDDLHWADRASIELLAHLVRRPPGSPVLIVGAYRPAQADPDLATAVERAQRESRATYVEPRPLTPGETGDLLSLDGAERDRLHALGGGNPFLLLELAKAGAAEADSNGQDLPRAVAAAIVTELAPLSDATRALAQGAAAVGDPFDLDIAAAAAGLSEVDALDSLDELARHDLVRRTDLPRRFAWRHPLVRHAIYESLPPGRRLAAHQRCADLLAARGAAAAERAVHVEFAARPGDDDAVDLLARAAEEAAARAPASAARWLRAALRLLPADGPPARRLELLIRLPALHTALGELAEGHASLLEALELVPTHDHALRTRLATTCAGMDQLLGNHDAAHLRLVEALEELPDDTSRESVDLMIALVMDSFYRKEPRAMQDWSSRAIDLAARWDDRPRIAAAHATRSLAYALSGDVAESEAHLSSAVTLIDAMPDTQLAERVDALGAVAGAELYLDRYREAAEHAERGLRIGRATGTAATAPTLIPTLGTALWVIGRLDDSLRLLDSSVEAARAARDQQGVAWHLFNLAYAQMNAGDVPGAVQSSKESLGIARGLGDSFVTTWSGAVAAAARLEHGDPEATLRIFDETAGGPGLDLLPGGWRCHFFEYAARAWLALDKPAQAEAAAGKAVAWGDSVGLPYGQSTAARAMARCALHRGDTAAAVDSARASVARAELASARFDTAVSRIVLGRALRLAGAREDAISELRAAAGELDSMGCHRNRDEAERELGLLGSRPHRRTSRGTGDSGVAALTSRELEIARLVADRRTNPEIAAHLFLSVKTVETHLRNIFRKLEVSSRADVARSLESSTDQ